MVALPDVVLAVITDVTRVMEAVIVNQDGQDRHATLVTNYCLIHHKLQLIIQYTSVYQILQEITSTVLNQRG